MKNPSESDRLFREMAKQYMEAEGADLRRELDPVRNVPVSTPRLDQRIGLFIRNRRRRIWAGVGAAAAAAAACLLAVLVLPVFLRYFPAIQTPSSSPEPPVLTAALPVNFSVAAITEDAGQNIYTLREAGGDDVIMTLEYTRDSIDTDGLQPLRLNGQLVYCRETADYALLLFQRKGVRYTLTCRYDMDTLLSLAKIL